MSPSSNGSEPDSRAVLVTGGTRGIGAVIAARFAADGARVLVCGRQRPAALPGGIGFHAADVREPDQAAELVAEAVRRFGRLDVVVNNAGGSPVVPADSASPRLVTSIVRLNLLAPFFVAQAANAVMREQPGGGHIVNIGSVAALRPAPGTAAYAAAKAGLEALTRALAVEWAPRVRVNGVIVGLVRTAQNAEHYGDEGALRAVDGTIPLGRMATPDDVADACLLLTSPLASYLNGAQITVDGGGELPAFYLATRGSDAGAGADQPA
ncbi:SDR family oxidoreductase [Phytohabitans sp. ZYX-F-186]|uniref:SDR family oxidoreductase n=1 Tax=Phytohabitans maris TaxID=3071409 RepID=A0ABU0ZBD5_9ACTN|nr:SDR family oxidoreductase [Phytohabitans sp. ZYX-F-186]MDQ7903744.1 SDR family oxidoreductase [Phytohabitans sp. ZYX-F-186]